MFLYSIKNVDRNPFYLLLSFIHPLTTDETKDQLVYSHSSKVPTSPYT